MRYGSAVKVGIGAAIFQLAVVLFCAGCWIGNVVKLVQCDWNAQGTWKGEVIHAVGLIGPAAVVTVWFNDK